MSSPVEFVGPGRVDFFDTTRAHVCTLVLVTVAIASAALSLEAADLNFERYDAANAEVWVLSGAALLLALAVSYWSLYVSMAMAQKLKPDPSRSDPHPLSPATLRSAWRTGGAHAQVRYRDLPSAWRSPWATTIRRLRVVAVLILYIVAQITIGHAGVAHGDYAFLAYGGDVVVLAILSLAVPILFVDIARRRDVVDDIHSLDELPDRPLLRRSLSLIVGVVLLIVSGVLLVDRIASVIDHPVTLTGRGATSVQLPPSTQTIYTGCDDSLQCSPLSVSDIKVVGTESHVRVTIIPDQGIDHESFQDQPWLSVASFKVSAKGRYLITLGGRRDGRYAVSLAQVEFLHVIAPLVVTTVLRVIGVGLGIAALFELSKMGRRRERRRTVSVPASPSTR
jgi:hypothetical protein